jgi:molybdopterin converting factor small subunit
MRVFFFAQLKDVTGCEAAELPLQVPANGDQLWARLLEKYPGLAAHRPHVRLTRNWEYAGPETRFANTDEVALIPPVSGG